MANSTVAPRSKASAIRSLCTSNAANDAGSAGVAASEWGATKDCMPHLCAGKIAARLMAAAPAANKSIGAGEASGQLRSSSSYTSSVASCIACTV